MHLPDGVLTPAACATGFATAAACCGLSLALISRRADPRQAVPKASMMTAAFFVASWIHLPVPPTSVHLVLNGLLGVMLGPFAFVAVLIGLFFQAVMFQHGGLTTLGVNATLIGLPALLCGGVFRLARGAWSRSRAWAAFIGFVAGAAGVGLAALGFSLTVVLAVPVELDASLSRVGIAGLTIGYLPVMVLEGVFTALVVLFLRRVAPTMLES